MKKKEKLVKNIEEIIKSLNNAADLINWFFDLEHVSDNLYTVREIFKKSEVFKENKKQMIKRIDKISKKVSEVFWRYIKIDDKLIEMIKKLEGLKEEINKNGEKNN